MKYQYQRTLLLAATIGLTGCVGESICDDYKAIPASEHDNTDLNIQVIGDSILAYHGINCKSVGHRIGLEIQESVRINPATGAKIREIYEQYAPPPLEGPDYGYVVINGGLNDLIANSKPGAPEETACDCNGILNHDACLQEIVDINEEMLNIINRVQSSSNATIALMSYYPPLDDNSFIGACFPYVDQLNESYRTIANADESVEYVETYGIGVPLIQTISPFGGDNYHPDPDGSEQMSFFIRQQLDL
ncbi:hypothetical protein A9Q99_08080 [Gammaproteobacteria bacterium 45_16_T64]|nr:hypothetical protein A9Q99_08080 [Gammaproteobacteria bacterium 45_16_T64]